MSIKTCKGCYWYSIGGEVCQCIFPCNDKNQYFSRRRFDYKWCPKCDKVFIGPPKTLVHEHRLVRG